MLFLFGGRTFGQEQKKQLFTLLQNSKVDAGRLKILHDLGNYYQLRHHGKIAADLDTAKAMFTKELDLSKLIKNQSEYGLTESLQKLGEIALSQNRVEDGKVYFTQAATLLHANGKYKNEAEAWQRLASCLRSYARELPNVKIYFEKALAIFQALKNTNDVIKVGYKIAQNDFYMTKNELAEQECLQLIEKYKHGNYQNVDLLYYLLSRMERYKGNLNNSLSFCLKAEKRMIETRDTLNAQLLYGELAQVYEATGQAEKSIYYYKKTIALREKMNAEQKFIFRTAGFMIQQMITQHKAAEGLAYITELEKRNPPDSEFEVAIISQIKAYCYEALGKIELAEIAYVTMIKVMVKDSSEIGQIAKLDIAKFYIHQKKYTIAGPYLKNLYSEDKQRASEIEFLHFKIDSAGGKYLAALDHFQRYKMLNDSIFTKSKIKQIEELQIKYETKQKEKDINLLKKDSLIQQGKIQQANTVRDLTLAGITALVIFLGLLYKGYRANRQKNAELNQLVNEKDDLLVEKEWLLKEIHHRVKNNLQIVMGLLQRQSSYIDNAEALTVLHNSENRMHSIALIHQKLYQSDNLDSISMPEYIDDLIGYLKDSFDIGSRIHFQKEVDDISLDVAQAVPLGLILNEAITNAIKYAYPDDTSGIITISFRREAGNHNLLLVKDQGTGLPSGFDMQKIDTLGINLMKGLSKQLGGVFKLEYTDGVTISIAFDTDRLTSADRRIKKAEYI